MNWASYTPHFDKSHDAPRGYLALWCEGPRGGTAFAGVFTPDELDQLALEAIRAAERERTINNLKGRIRSR
jgi:hypothetical protein